MSASPSAASSVRPVDTKPHPRLSINQATIKYANLADALSATAEAGVEAIGLWREPVNEVGLATAAQMLNDSGLRFTTHCRGGFFTLPDGTARSAALDDNRRAIEETATLAAAGAAGSTSILVLVAGGLPEGSRDIAGARERVRDAIGELVPDAAAAGVTLAIEPLHPMYATDRCVVSTLGQALDIAADFDAAAVGATVDTFHIFWDPQVLDQIARAGREGRIATYQVCDWRTPLAADVLLSRHYPGDGVIDFGALTRAVVDAGYTGDIEVEIFNEDVWATDPLEAVRRTSAAFSASVAPHLA
ncbi:sugar phosphate isomerase/epimerase family protein [Microbacterium sp. NPDC055903]